MEARPEWRAYRKAAKPENVPVGAATFHIASGTPRLAAKKAGEAPAGDSFAAPCIPEIATRKASEDEAESDAAAPAIEAQVESEAPATDAAPPDDRDEERVEREARKRQLCCQSSPNHQILKLSMEFPKTCPTLSANSSVSRSVCCLNSSPSSKLTGFCCATPCHRAMIPARK